MSKWIYILSLFIFLNSCKRDFEAPVPDTRWDLFNSPAATPLTNLSRQKLEGVYVISDGEDAFGQTSAAKWSYTAHGNDTTYHLSLFFEKQVSYMILEGKKLDSSILLNGYWRKMVNTETGKARLTITAANGAAYILNGTTADSIIITGVFGNGNNPPDQSIKLHYKKALYAASPLEIVGHRGGGSTADLLPASENSTAIIEMASRFGATGVEIDVRMTSDSVLILYHDATLNERLVKKNGLLGTIENYSYAQLN